MQNLDQVRHAYDLASSVYVEKYSSELEHKPFDRELLREFATTVGKGKIVLDIGCGPGHTTDQLTSLGLSATGIDLSPRMIELARQLFPTSRFEVGDFLELTATHARVHGLLAFYSIVHFESCQLANAFAEFYKVLDAGGLLALAFHAGKDVIHTDNFLGTDAKLDFQFFEPQTVESELAAAGFVSIDVRVRDPYPTEYPSKRCYAFAFKPLNQEPNETKATVSPLLAVA